MPKVGIAFRGGLAKGFGGIALVRLLEEMNIKPHVLAGSSSGAIVAAMWAYGMTSKEMIDVSQSFKFLDVISPTAIYKTRSIVDYDKFRNEMTQRVGDLRFEDLKTPLVVVTTNEETFAPVYLDQGNLADAIVSTCGFRPIFPKNLGLVDGDYQPGYPSEVLREKGAEFTIGVTQKTHNGKSVSERVTGRLAPDIVDRLSYSSMPDYEVVNQANIGYIDFHRIPDLVESAEKQITAYSQLF